MRQKYRTTCFADSPLHYEKSFDDTADRRGDVVGFRLVHDGANQVRRGGTWGSPAEYAEDPYRATNQPEYRFLSLGIRLCVDWREE